jgi:hypothetical protein
VAAKSTAAGGAKQDDGSFASNNLSIDDITYLVAAVGVLGLLLVVIGVVAIRRSRAARRAAARSGGAAAAGGGPGPLGPGGPGGAAGPGGGRGGPRTGNGTGRAAVPSSSFDDFDDFDEPITRGGRTAGRGVGERGPRAGGGPGAPARQADERTGSVYRTSDIRTGTGDGRAGGAPSGAVYGRREPAVADSGWPDADDEPRGYGRR